MGANAQTTVPTFTASQVLTADQMNQSARTGVPVFSSTGNRDAGFGGSGEKTLAEGQIVYVEGTGLQTYNGTGWVTWGTAPSVFQVKSAAKTDTFTSTSTTYTDITGLSVAITPTSASNKVLIIAQLTVGIGAGASTDVGQFRFTGGNSTNYVGDTASARTRGVFGGFGHAAFNSLNLGLSMVYLDSPATTSATTYKIQGKVSTTYTGTFYINRSGSDNDNDGHTRGASSITVMEVAP